MALFWWLLLTLPPVHSKRCFGGKIIYKNNRMKRTTSFNVTIACSVFNINIRYEDFFLPASYLDMQC